METTKSKKISSVLSKFESTIRENNEAGVSSNMYLSNIAKSKTPLKLAAPKMQSVSRRASCASGISLSNFEPAKKFSMNHASECCTVSTAMTSGSGSTLSSSSDHEWTTFGPSSSHHFNASFGSFGSSGGNDDDDGFGEQTFDFEEDDWDAPISSSNERRSTEQSTRGNRSTRPRSTGKDARRRTPVKRVEGSEVTRRPRATTGSSRPPTTRRPRPSSTTQAPPEDDGFKITYQNRPGLDDDDSSHISSRHSVRSTRTISQKPKDILGGSSHHGGFSSEDDEGTVGDFLHSSEEKKAPSKSPSSRRLRVNNAEDGGRVPRRPLRRIESRSPPK